MPTTSLLLFALLGAAQADAGIAVPPGARLIEAETFDLAAGWEVQARLPGFSGKGYLTERARPGILGSVPRLQLTLEKAGKHAVWVRAFAGGEPGSGFYQRDFAVETNGTRLPPTHLGAEENRFAWELAGEIAVGEDRTVELRLRDVGRSEAVIDCLLLTDDLQFRPPGWTGNSTRPGEGPFRRLRETPAPAAKPFVLPPAERQHVETISAPSHTYHVAMGGTLDEFNTAKYPDTYGGCKRIDWEFQPNQYLILENRGRQDLVHPRIVVGGRRDWYSAETILAGIITPGMSDAEKALAIWAFTADIAVQGHDNNRRVGPTYPDDRSHPSRGTFRERADPVKAANVYYCSGCNYGAATCAVLARCAGLASRCVWMCPFDQYENHCVAEVFFDGRWHVLDPEERLFYLEADNRTVASYESLHRRPELAARTHEGGFAAKYMDGSHAKGYQSHYPPAVMPIDTWTSTMSMRLRPGEKFIWRWAHDSKFRYGQNPRNTNLLPYHLANGKLIYQPDLRAEFARQGILAERNIKTAVEDGNGPAVHADTPGLVSSVTYKIESPYPIVGGTVGGTFIRKSSGDPARILLSADDSDWTEIWSAREDEIGQLEPALAVDAVLGNRSGPERHACYVKYEFLAGQSPVDAGLERIYLEIDVQMAATSLPSLAVGVNEVVYRDETPGERDVRIIHGWRESSATRPPAAPARPASPGDRTSVAEGLLGKLAWTPAEDPDADPIAAYHVQVSPRDDFLYPVSPNFDRLIASAQPEWPVPQGWLIPGQMYCWRVRARDAQGAWSPWSQTWHFKIDQPPESEASRQ